MNAGCAGKAVRSLENACHTRAPYAVVTSEIKLKQNNFTETKHCFAFVLFQSCFSFISVITIAFRGVFTRKRYTKTPLPYLYLCTTVLAYSQNMTRIGNQLGFCNESMAVIAGTVISEMHVSTSVCA